MVLQSKENNSTSRDSWHATSGSFLPRKRVGRSRIDTDSYFQNRYAYRVSSNFPGNWLANIEEQFKLPGVAPVGREIGGDMRCGYSRIMEVIRMSYHRNPYKGDVFFFMSKNERSVRMVMYEKHAFNVHTCTFAKGYRFMKIRFEEEKSVYQVDWKDIVSILESPVVKEILVNEKRS